jgi:hypothetical protein
MSGFCGVPQREGCVGWVGNSGCAFHDPYIPEMPRLNRDWLGFARLVGNEEGDWGRGFAILEMSSSVPTFTMH